MNYPYQGRLGLPERLYQRLLQRAAVLGLEPFKTFIESELNQCRICQEMVDNHIIPAVVPTAGQVIAAKGQMPGRAAIPFNLERGELRGWVRGWSEPASRAGHRGRNSGIFRAIGGGVHHDHQGRVCMGASRPRDRWWTQAQLDRVHEYPGEVSSRLVCEAKGLVLFLQVGSGAWEALPGVGLLAVDEQVGHPSLAVAVQFVLRRSAGYSTGS